MEAVLILTVLRESTFNREQLNRIARGAAFEDVEIRQAAVYGSARPDSTLRRSCCLSSMIVIGTSHCTRFQISVPIRPEP
jgi:hypothetical protein